MVGRLVARPDRRNIFYATGTPVAHFTQEDCVLNAVREIDHVPGRQLVLGGPRRQLSIDRDTHNVAKAKGIDFAAFTPQWLDVLEQIGRGQSALSGENSKIPFTSRRQGGGGGEDGIERA